ncbi:MAG: hypothetical protein GX793_10680 [Bacteroidales bacterium]|nr:hypothetical protein [Bacteroidales bacterium]MCK9498181.1 hypothetical protein [Bacteroidales bacterium]MDY0313500.1 hypothetical protein [Bacteroidales bacterium]NLB87512.1 hypothetical protein [Bacteroidales bacterium]
MKTSLNINILFVISSLSLMLFLNSCDDDYIQNVDSETIDCQYCYENLPQLVEMKLIFNMKKYKEEVYFTVYSGNAFSSAIWMQGCTDNNELWIEVQPNQKYTVVAEYLQDDKIIYVINDAVVKTKFFKNLCDEPCHYVYEVSCDLKLGKHKYN